MAFLPMEKLSTLTSTISYRRASEADADKTYAQQLTALQTAFNSLTSAEKFGSFLTLSTAIYPCVLGSGTYGATRMNDTQILTISFEIQNAKAYRSINGAVPPTDISNLNSSNKMILYVPVVTTTEDT